MGQNKLWEAPLDLEDQVFGGLFESDDCWDFSGVSIMEIVLKNLFPQLSPAAQSFFITNRFCDAAGNFALSRRYIAVLSGVKNNGNFQEDFWILAGEYGIIPRSMLDFTPSEASYASFVADFFNPASVTDEMKALGKQVLSYITISSDDISEKEMPAQLIKTPLQVGIPIPQPASNWNKTYVKWDGSTISKHAVALLGLNPDGTRAILDSYNIAEKTLSADYPLNIITLPLIAIRQPTKLGDAVISPTVLQQFIAVLKKIGLWTKAA